MPRAWNREQLSCAKSVYKLAEEKIDMLQPEHLPTFKPSSVAAEASARALAELKSVVDSRLQVCREGLRNAVR